MHDVLPYGYAAVPGVTDLQRLESRIHIAHHLGKERACAAGAFGIKVWRFHALLYCQCPSRQRQLELESVLEVVTHELPLSAATTILTQHLDHELGRSPHAGRLQILPQRSVKDRSHDEIEQCVVQCFEHCLVLVLTAQLDLRGSTAYRELLVQDSSVFSRQIQNSPIVQLAC